MKKISLSALITVFSLLILSGCCKEHQWMDATCDAPRTCSVCGKTDGEKLEHVWDEATCAAPKTCALCGITEGDALPHTEGTPANYQSGAICPVCGAETSNKIAPDFESKNIPGTFIDVMQTVPYITACYEDPTQLTTGQATVIEYDRFDSDETHEAKEDYEWIKVTWQITYDDENANNYGFMTGMCSEDYYSPKLYDDSSVALGDDETIYSHTVNWNGQDYTECIHEYGMWNWGEGWSDSSITGTYTSYELVPVGYDGFVEGLRNRQVEWADGQYIYDVADADTIFFRCN